MDVLSCVFSVPTSFSCWLNDRKKRFFLQPCSCCCKAESFRCFFPVPFSHFWKQRINVNLLSWIWSQTYLQTSIVESRKGYDEVISLLEVYVLHIASQNKEKAKRHLIGNFCKRCRNLRLLWLDSTNYPVWNWIGNSNNLRTSERKDILFHTFSLCSIGMRLKCNESFESQIYQDER